MRILFIGSDLVGVAQFGHSLQALGYDVSIMADEGLSRAAASAHPHDAVVLHAHASFPDVPAFIESLRGDGLMSALFAVCASDDHDAAARLLDAGADCILDTEFVATRIAAQLRAVVRRAAETVQVGDLLINRVSHGVSVNGTPLLLTARQYALLEYLALRSGATVLRSTLISHVWKLQFDPGSNVVDVHVAQLRKRLRDAGSMASLRTIRGEGYALDPVGDLS